MLREKKGDRTRKREKYLKEKMIRQKKKSRVKRLRMMERR